jgi:bifunctional DNase/RNase
MSAGRDGRGATGFPLVPVTVKSVNVDPLSGMPSLVLLDEEGRRSVGIDIGVGEASAITAVLNQIQLERPVCHDLLKQVLVLSEMEFIQAEVRDAPDTTQEAVIVLRGRDGAERRLSARPSDAIALALRMGGVILMSPRLLRAAPRPGAPEGSDLSDVPFVLGRSRSGRFPRFPSSPPRRPRLKM